MHFPLCRGSNVDAFPGLCSPGSWMSKERMVVWLLALIRGGSKHRALPAHVGLFVAAQSVRAHGENKTTHVLSFLIVSKPRPTCDDGFFILNRTKLYLITSEWLNEQRHYQCLCKWRKGYLGPIAIQCTHSGNPHEWYMLGHASCHGSVPKHDVET